MTKQATVERPLRADAERNRQRILEAARVVFAERGTEASLDDVAREAGVGVGTVYRRFPDKHALIDAIFEAKIDEVHDLALEALEHDDAWEGFEFFFTKVCEIHARDRSFKKVLLTHEEAQERVNRSRARIQPVAGKVVERAQESGQLRADIAPLDIPLMHSMIGTLATSTRELDPEYWRRALRVMLDGMKVQREAPTPMPAEPMDRDQFIAAMSASHAPTR